MTPIEKIQTLYGAFGRGDIPAILAELSEQVEWEYNSFPNPIPWLQPLKGRANAARFFQALGAIDITQFEPKHFFASGNMVVDLIDISFTVKATGKKVVEPETVHIWHLNDQGQVLRFRHRADTWQTVQALKGD